MQCCAPANTLVYGRLCRGVCLYVFVRVSIMYYIYDSIVSADTLKILVVADFHFAGAVYCYELSQQNPSKKRKFCYCERLCDITITLIS